MFLVLLETTMWRFVLFAAALLSPLIAGAAGPTTAPAPFDDSRLMPAKPIGGMPFQDVLELIKADQPGLTYIIFRNPGVPAAYPVMPQMELDHVTVRMYLQLVSTNFPGVQIQRISPDEMGVPWSGNLQGGHDPDAQPLMVFRIEPTAGQLATMKLAPPATPAEPTEVHVYRMTAMIDRMVEAELSSPGGSAEDVRKKLASARPEAMERVLSLIEAALDPVGGPIPSIKVHGPTQTLIFKGTGKQRDVVEQVMRELTPGSWERARPVPTPTAAADPTRADQLTQARAEVDRLQLELEMRKAASLTATAQREASERDLASAVRRLSELADQAAKANAYSKSSETKPAATDAVATRVEQLKATKAQLEASIAAESAKYGPQNPVILSLRARLDAVQAELSKAKE